MKEEKNLEHLKQEILNIFLGSMSLDSSEPDITSSSVFLTNPPKDIQKSIPSSNDVVDQYRNDIAPNINISLQIDQALKSIPGIKLSKNQSNFNINVKKNDRPGNLISNVIGASPEKIPQPTITKMFDNRKSSNFFENVQPTNDYNNVNRNVYMSFLTESPYSFMTNTSEIYVKEKNTSNDSIIHKYFIPQTTNTFIDRSISQPQINTLVDESITNTQSQIVSSVEPTPQSNNTFIDESIKTITPQSNNTLITVDESDSSLNIFKNIANQSKITNNNIRSQSNVSTFEDISNLTQKSITQFNKNQINSSNYTFHGKPSYYKIQTFQNNSKPQSNSSKSRFVDMFGAKEIIHKKESILLIPAFAEGGFINKPTIGMVGESGPEVVKGSQTFNTPSIAKLSSNSIISPKSADSIAAKASASISTNEKSKGEAPSTDQEVNDKLEILKKAVSSLAADTPKTKTELPTHPNPRDGSLYSSLSKFMEYTKSSPYWREQ